MNNIATISEFGLIGTNKNVLNANKFLSAQIDELYYKELELFAKTDKGKDILQFTGNGKYMQSKNYIGTIQTISGFTLEILPKTTRVNKNKNEENIFKSKEVFMKLLYLLYKLPKYKNINSANFQRIKNLDIFEIFITMFLNEIEIIIKKGIKSDYVEQENNLYYLKGKLIINKQINKNNIHKERFHVQYDDYNQNRAENRLIKSTLQLLLKLSKNYNNIRRIRQYNEHMNWVELSNNIDNDLRSIKTNKGMEYYKNALIWSKVFLKKESFSSFEGDTIAFAILYPMEKLFECFVEWWLNKEYSDLEIESQNGGYDFVKQLFTVRPDFLIKKDNRIISVADAKWKLIDKDSDFSQSDFYQLFTYKHIFLKKQEENYEKDKNRLMNLKIYYPKSLGLQKIREYEYFGEEGRIKIIPLDIEKELMV